ncbi:MAG: hypothetical protein AAF611_12555 [Bacteroidota bacterium]
MKKRNFKSLALNKESISNLRINNAVGGNSEVSYMSYRGWTCPHDASQFSNCEDRGGEDPKDPTSRPTVETLELSYCPGIGMPPTCMSIVCA